ncbi:unnamed protein product [Caretta caretta]
MTGLVLREPELRLVLSAYADDVLLVVQDPGDLARVEACQAVYSAASSACVNWVKSSGLVEGLILSLTDSGLGMGQEEGVGNPESQDATQWGIGSVNVKQSSRLKKKGDKEGKSKQGKEYLQESQMSGMDSWAMDMAGFPVGKQGSMCPTSGTGEFLEIGKGKGRSMSHSRQRGSRLGGS